MGIVVSFHATSRSFADKAASNSSVTPDCAAGSSETSAAHHSGGMLLRCHHLVTTHSPAPKSARRASRVGQSSMIDRNEVSSDMNVTLGQPVPNVKANMSQDGSADSGHNVLMFHIEEPDDVWEAAMRKRLKDIRGGRTHQDMADLLHITRDRWNKYENRDPHAIPLRLLPKIAKLAERSVEWLITGKEIVPRRQKQAITKHQRETQ